MDIYEETFLEGYYNALDEYNALNEEEMDQAYMEGYLSALDEASQVDKFYNKFGGLRTSTGYRIPTKAEADRQQETTNRQELSRQLTNSAFARTNYTGSRGRHRTHLTGGGKASRDDYKLEELDQAYMDGYLQALEEAEY